MFQVGWSRTARDFIMLLSRTAHNLKLMNHLWNFPFNILNHGWLWKSKTVDKRDRCNPVHMFAACTMEGGGCGSWQGGPVSPRHSAFHAHLCFVHLGTQSLTHYRWQITIHGRCVTRRQKFNPRMILICSLYLTLTGWLVWGPWETKFSSFHLSYNWLNYFGTMVLKM